MPELLLLLLALPLATTIGVAALGPGRAEAVRRISLASTLVSLLVAVILTIQFAIPRVHQQQSVTAPKTFEPIFVPGSTPEQPHRTTWNLLPLTADSAIQFYVGIDGLNVWLILLTALLMMTSVLVSWTAIRKHIHEFHAWLFVLQLGMTGVFASFDVILFYVFFELTLVPLFFLIGIWGGPQRQYAARKFFIYTLTGSLLTLLGVIAVALIVPQMEPSRKLTFSIPELVASVNALNRQLPAEVRQNEEAPPPPESGDLEFAPIGSITGTRYRR